jgi:hypothetical protein
MNRRVLAFAAGISCLAAGVWIYDFLFVPIDDPTYFCAAPDPTPLTTISGALVLQECAAAKTFTVEIGRTIALDLSGSAGVDTSDVWMDVTVSDASVLNTVSGPARIEEDSTYRRVDEVAIYKAAKSGQATISAVRQRCGGNTGRCDKGHRWRATLRVN